MFASLYEKWKLVKKRNTKNTKLDLFMHSTKSQSKEICALSYYLPYFIGNYTKSMDLWNWSLQPTSDAEIKSMVKGF